MKEKKPMIKKWGALLSASLYAALILSCSPLFETLAEADRGSGETGRVVLSVSTGGAAAARTVLPATAPVFSRYELVFSMAGAEDVTVTDTAGIAGDGVSQELPAGTWTATVTAYRTFTVTGGTEREYKAARGSSSPITVAAGQITPVTVKIEPLPVADETANGSLRGIFTYTVSFPDDATASLTFGSDAAVTLTSEQKVSVEKAPGYYDLFITAAKGSLSAGRAEKVHIYAGLESAAVFAFKNEDFVQQAYLTGTLTLPNGGASVSGGTISAYSDAGYTSRIEIGTPSVPEGDGSWLMAIPAANVSAGTVYLKAVITGNDTKTYVLTGNTTGAVPEEGVQGIVLTNSNPAPVIGLAGIPGFGDGKVKLTWTDPADEDLDHIEIRWITIGGDDRHVTADKSSLEDRTNSITIDGLTNGTAYTFTLTAVDTAENKSADASTKPLKPDAFSINRVSNYLDDTPGGTTVANPIPLTVELNIATDWSKLLTAIATADKKVALDLSACTMTGTEFDPGTANTGEKNIVSLVLPDVATSIKKGTRTAPTFQNFTALRSVSGEKVQIIGDHAFKDCAGLTTVVFPEATSIGERAFQYCTALTTAYLDAATDIGGYAFYGCAGLTTAYLNAAESIGIYAFYGCTGLTTVYLDAARYIGNYAFYACTGTQDLTITLGAEAPALERMMFHAVSLAKTVIVKVPSGANGYGNIPGSYTADTTTPNWGNGFRGGGWTGDSFVSGANVNGNITLKIELRQ